VAFKYNVSDKLKEKLKNFLKKDKRLLVQLHKKIEEVIARDSETIDFYKNLRTPMEEYKRVQVGHFVLIFHVDKKLNEILFQDFDHHDNIYDKK